MSVRTPSRHRKPAPDARGNPDGNERLTAMTGAVLLVLLAAEGVTILAKRQLLTAHFFIGFLLVGPVLLKIGSTCYRFVRYYTGASRYVRKGPPALLLRVLGPVVIGTSAGVIGSGIGLAFYGPRPMLLLAHKAFFLLWFAAMTIHVLWYAPRLPNLLSSRSAGRDRVRAALAGAGRRWMLLTAAMALGLVLALATYHLAGSWTSFMSHGGGQDRQHGTVPVMTFALSAATLRLLDGRNYAVLATVNPDGSPQTSAMWVGRDGSDLLFSTVAGRVKHRNMVRDPRVSVTVLDAADAENYVELRGRVSITPDEGRKVDTALSWKYDSKDPDEDPPGAVRVVVRMVVEKATGYAA